MENEVEIWKDVVGYEGLYAVSSLGRVYSSFTKKILSPCLNQVGYLHVRLSKNGKATTKRINVLVAKAFIDPLYIEKGLVCDHLDDDKKNNILSNLEIKTNRENVSKSIKKIKTSSKYIGVSYSRNTKKWRAFIGIKDKKTDLGLFDSELDAHHAYQSALFCINNGLVSDIIVKRRKSKGYYFRKKTGKWRAYIWQDGNNKHIGTFNTENEAQEAREKYIKTTKTIKQNENNIRTSPTNH